MPNAPDILAQWEAVCEAAKEIPTDARADWKCSNHYEIQSPNGDSFWWLVIPELLHLDDWNDSEPGQRLGMVLDYACAARTGWPAAIKALKVAREALRHYSGVTYGYAAAMEAEKEIDAILEGRDAR